MHVSDQFGCCFGLAILGSKISADGPHDGILHIGEIIAQLLSLGIAKASFREPNRCDREQSEEKSSLDRITVKQIDCGMVLKALAIQILIRKSQYRSRAE